MIRLTPSIALVSGGTHTGFGLTSDFDAHGYLLDGGDELALVDPGMGTAAGMQRLLANLASLGVDPSRVRRILLTHVHTDHAAGAARYREHFRARVAIGAASAPALAAADDAATQLAAAQRAGIFAADVTFPACPVDDPLDDGDELRIGDLTVRALATPGHCAGHTSYLVTGASGSALLSGDALFHGGRVLVQAIPDCDVRAMADTIRRLAALRFDALLPGHGALALTGGSEHAGLALAGVERLAMPRNLV